MVSSVTHTPNARIMKDPSTVLAWKDLSEMVHYVQVCSVSPTISRSDDKFSKIFDGMVSIILAVSISDKEGGGLSFFL